MPQGWLNVEAVAAPFALPAEIGLARRRDTTLVERLTRRMVCEYRSV